MAWYYPECDSRSLFFKNLPLKSFDSDGEAVQHYRAKYGSKLMAVVKDNDPEITAVYERACINCNSEGCPICKP